MKANLKIFQAIADLAAKGLSPSRAGKVLKLSPDTVSRWRAEIPDFTEMLDQAESAFIQRMTTAIADAAPTDWRAAVEILARRFPAEFGRDSTGANREVAKPFVDRETRWCRSRRPRRDARCCSRRDLSILLGSPRTFPRSKCRV